MRHQLNFLLILPLLFLISVPGLKADLILLPESRHQQYQTFGLFIDQQSILVYRSRSRAWGAIAGNIALLEKPDWQTKPQLVLNGSANASFRLNQKIDTLLTETDDARVGLAVDFSLNEKNLLSLGWTHQSGHISDNVENVELIGPNLGNEILHLRYLYTGLRDFRLGGTFRPIVGSEPKMQFLAFDQFAEWFPWGIAEDMRRFTPYLAIGLEEYGKDQLELSAHIQAGAYLGNHTEPKKHSNLRLVTGVYSGVDPRLKYAQFKNGNAKFFYLGLMFDI